MSFITTFTSLLRVILCIVNNIYAIPVYLCLYLLLQPLRIFSPLTFWAIEGWLYEKLLSMVAFWAQLSGHEIFTSGDDISSIINDESILMTNHQSSGDIPVLMHALRGTRPSLRGVMWIMDWVLQFLSFGWIAKGHGDFFLLQGSDIRKFPFLFSGSEAQIKIDGMKRFKKHLVDVYCKRDRKWMILFPEGGFLHKRREGSWRFSKRNNLPLLNNVTIPRVGAFQAIVDVLGVEGVKNGLNKDSLGKKHIKWIIDVTIGYAKNEPLGITSWVMGSGGPKKVYLHYRVFRSSDMMTKVGEGGGYSVSEAWIYDRFIEKDKLLKDFFATGKFPPGKQGLKPVKCYTISTLIGHVFCLLPYFILAYFIF
ncbi:acyl-CoA:lysophosphatidylglycerol acyltransferase 1-like [Styela clava]